jgi:hypothetical protein
MKRIFEVNGSFFDNKADAKVARGDKIANKDGEGFHYAHPVSKGPDHIGNHGVRVPNTYHRGQRDTNGHRNTPGRSR